MALKEKKSEERIEKRGDKFVYFQEREIEMDFDDLLGLATRERIAIEEGKKNISLNKAKMRNANNFLSKNKKLIDLAKEISEAQYCEKCGMDFKIPQNSSMRSSKTKAPYKVLCKNCATKEGA